MTITKTNKLRQKCSHAAETLTCSTSQIKANLISITKSLCSIRGSRHSLISISSRVTNENLDKENDMSPARFDKYQRSLPVVISPLTALITIISLVAIIICATTLVSAHESSLASPLKKQQPVAQKRLGGLDPSDYVDEAGELDIMANQQQISTAQLMGAAGHIIPENFFLPGGSIPSQITAAKYSNSVASYLQQAQQQQQQQVFQPLNHQDPMQQVASHVHARHNDPQLQQRPHQQQSSDTAAKVAQPVNRYQQMLELRENQQLIDYNNLKNAAQQDPRDSATHTSLAEFLASNNQPVVSMFEPSNFNQQQQRDHMITATLAEQQMAARLAAIQHQRAHQHSEPMSPQASESSPVESSSHGLPVAGNGHSSISIGPEYSVAGHESTSSYGGYEQQQQQQQRQQYPKNQQQPPFGLPTKSGGRFAEGIIRPLGDVQGFSSPVLNSALSAIPKTPNIDNLVNQIPASQTPTVFSFSSAVDPMVKVKTVNQKTRNVIKQAEQVARATLKVINRNLGTTFGEEQQEPILLNPNGPLGFVNYLVDPGLFISALNSAEKSYQSNILPAPLKAGLGPVLNIFRVPNKKRDKANLLNLINMISTAVQHTQKQANYGGFVTYAKDTKISAHR